MYSVDAQVLRNEVAKEMTFMIISKDYTYIIALSSHLIVTAATEHIQKVSSHYLVNSLPSFNFI